MIDIKGDASVLTPRPLIAPLVTVWSPLPLTTSKARDSVWGREQPTTSQLLTLRHTSPVLEESNGVRAATYARFSFSFSLLLLLRILFPGPGPAHAVHPPLPRAQANPHPLHGSVRMRLQASCIPAPGLRIPLSVSLPGRFLMAAETYLPASAGSILVRSSNVNVNVNKCAAASRAALVNTAHKASNLRAECMKHQATITYLNLLLGKPMRGRPHSTQRNPTPLMPSFLATPRATRKSRDSDNYVPRPHGSCESRQIPRPSFSPPSPMHIFSLILPLLSLAPSPPCARSSVHVRQSPLVPAVGMPTRLRAFRAGVNGCDGAFKPAAPTILLSSRLRTGRAQPGNININILCAAEDEADGLSECPKRLP
ncbi:hypothetical protein FB451DRAFT_1571211 [Mycena latifolia]|nr:hypothetical protein FB451DRAFT_1571211 [Mycena latifolia]